MSNFDFFSDRFNSDRGRVVDVATLHFTEVYVAYAIWENGFTEDAEPDKVVAIVCLTKWVPNDASSFGYKAMDETAGPYYTNCPERILRQLTPTSNERARQWRKACWDNVKKRQSRPTLKRGDVVLFNHALDYGAGREKRILQVVSDGRKLRFADFPSSEEWGRYRVRRADLDGALAISSPNPRAEMMPSAHLQVLMAEYASETIGQAHSLVCELDLLAYATIRNAERASEDMANLLRATIKLVHEYGAEAVEDAYVQIQREALQHGIPRWQASLRGGAGLLSQDIARAARRLLSESTAASQRATVSATEARQLGLW